MAQNLPDPAPYAGGPPSMNKFQAGQGPADTRSPGKAADISLASPMGDLMPYANEARTVATDESGQGSYEGDAPNVTCDPDVHSLAPYAGN